MRLRDGGAGLERVQVEVAELFAVRGLGAGRAKRSTRRAGWRRRVVAAVAVVRLPDLARLLSERRIVLGTAGSAFHTAIFAAPGRRILGLNWAPHLNANFPLLDAQNGIVNAILVYLGIVDNPVAFFANLRTVWPSIVTIIVWNTVPLVAISLLASLQSIPEELNEAAALDGASRRQQFRYITLPFLMPTIIVLMLMSVFWTFNNFDDIYLLTGGGSGTQVVTVRVFDYLMARGDIGAAAAQALVLAAILAVLVGIYLRLFGRSEEAA